MLKYFSSNPVRDPRQFVGREREIVHITELLAAGRSCVVVGPDGSGKTSLLHHIAQTAALVLDEPPLVVSLDAATIRQASQLYQPVLAALRQSGDDELALDQAFQTETPPLLLLLDNLDRAGAAFNGVVRSALRGWVSQHKLQILAASALPLEQTAPDMQTALVTVPMPPLIEREARALLAELAAQAKLDLPTATINELMQVAGTQPAQLKFALDAWARSDNGKAFEWQRTVREHAAATTAPPRDSYTVGIETEANQPQATQAALPRTLPAQPETKPKPPRTYRADDPSDFLWTLILLAVAVFVWWLIGSWWGVLGFAATLLVWVGLAHGLVAQNPHWRNNILVAATRRLPFVGRFAPRED